MPESNHRILIVDDEALARQRLRDGSGQGRACTNGWHWEACQNERASREIYLPKARVAYADHESETREQQGRNAMHEAHR